MDLHSIVVNMGIDGYVLFSLWLFWSERVTVGVITY